MTNIKETLETRGLNYGTFEDNAATSQALKDVIRRHPNYNQLEPVHKEALDMVFHKIARIINGDPDFIDSWHDMVGYSHLVEQYIEEKAKEI
jgi:GTP1/Obg family GTP-binding protein